MAKQKMSNPSLDYKSLNGKRVLIFSDYYPLVVGGAELQAKTLAEALAQAGARCVFISLNHRSKTLLNDEGHKVYCFPPPSGLRERLSLYRLFFRQIAQIIRAEKIDLVYQRLLNSFSPLLAAFCAKHNLPFVLHFGNHKSLAFAPNLTGALKFRQWRYTLRHPVKYIVQNETQARQLKNYSITADLQIPNWLDLTPSAKVKPAKPYPVLWIGNQRPVKRLDLFLELCKSFDASNYRFKVIGKLDDPKYRQQIEALPQVEYLGLLSLAQVNEELSLALALVNTSDHEGFSNTFLQAWHFGTPVLSLNSDPNHYLGQAKAGLCGDGQLAALQEQLEHYGENKGDFEAHSNAALALCQTELSFEKNRHKILGFLNRIMQEHGRKTR